MRNLTPGHHHPGLRRLCQERALGAHARPAGRAWPATCTASCARTRSRQAEWGAAIDALTRAMKFTDDKRNEYILFSDLLGVSSLVDMVNAATSAARRPRCWARSTSKARPSWPTAATCGTARSASRWW